jgi:hypothetical protein
MDRKEFNLLYIETLTKLQNTKSLVQWPDTLLHNNYTKVIKTPYTSYCKLHNLVSEKYTNTQV